MKHIEILHVRISCCTLSSCNKKYHQKVDRRIILTKKQPEISIKTRFAVINIVVTKSNRLLLPFSPIKSPLFHHEISQ
ncbi:hypothetical protein A9B99_19740 [Mangrovibacter phragmitis]|uniref:Uncharacterized protein n=1 Tax=Mangrovibacter phragmitis TaxID=1691903 RepID=A0A1B7L699_9ENTR|nr:hypothetical protein A9B99_19740 [Mangrovibacter phragmitis]